MQSASLNTRIESLEFNLKKIKEELILEKIRLGDDAKERLNIIRDHHANNESDEKSIYSNIDKNDEPVEKVFSNPVRR